MLIQLLLILAQKSNHGSGVIKSLVTVKVDSKLFYLWTVAVNQSMFLDSKFVSFKRNMAQLYLRLHLAGVWRCEELFFQAAEAGKAAEKWSFVYTPLFRRLKKMESLTSWSDSLMEIVTIISKHLGLSDGLTLALCECGCAACTLQSMCAGA